VLAILVLGIPVVHAADSGVILITAEPVTEPVRPATLDDMKLNVPVEIPGHALVTITSADFYDELTLDESAFEDGAGNLSAAPSGPDAEFLLLYVDILNISAGPVDYVKSMSVTITHQNAYMYGGFAYQCNYALRDAPSYAHALSLRPAFPFKVAATSEVGLYGTGHYAIGCALPQNVVTSKTSPLQVTLKLDGHEIVYHVNRPSQAVPQPQEQPRQKLHIVGASSPAFFNRYPPENILDEDEETCWQYNRKSTRGNGYKTHIILRLSAPAKVETLQVKNGFWKITSGIDQYWRNNRIKEAILSFQYEGRDDFIDPIAYTFADEKEVADINLGAREGVVAIMFQIESVYRGNKFDDVAVTYMEVFGYPDGQ